MKVYLKTSMKELITWKNFDFTNSDEELMLFVEVEF